MGLFDQPTSLAVIGNARMDWVQEDAHGIAVTNDIDVAIHQAVSCD